MDHPANGCAIRKPFPAYALSPGFENNEGGYGELTWSLEADKINVSHSNRYIETNTTEHEGL